MLTKGPARKVTIFINEDTQHHMTALHDSLMGVPDGTRECPAPRPPEPIRDYGVAPDAALTHKVEELNAAPAHPNRVRRDAGEGGRGSADSL